MHLNQLINNIHVLEIKGDSAIRITSIGFDSRNITKGQLFIALSGTRVDGHHFIDETIDKGATAIVCEHFPENLQTKICYIKVADSKKAIGIIASEFYGNPSRQLKLIGVTGTNGKTTTATLLYRLFRALGYKTGLLSTVVNFIDGKEMKASLTTPDAIQLNHLLADMVDAGCKYCFMEVSSHAIIQGRVGGLHFAGGIFSNITHEHLDYHKTFDEYIRVKKMFFDSLPSSAFALINVDDRNGNIMIQNTEAKVKKYSLRTQADYHCRIIENSFDGMMLNIDGKEFWTSFIGTFNAYNLLAVYATACLLEAEKEETLRLLSGMQSVAGRFEYVRSKNNIIAIVDYAHTPDALQNVLNTINEIRRGEQLITVVGCGGNRDKSKRPIMACIAVNNSSKAIFTSDNPRFEEPDAILEDMRAGLNAAQRSKMLMITDRREAIRTAAMLAQTGDIILIAGKGHEDYQEVKGIKTHFDDKEIIKEMMEG